MTIFRIIGADKKLEIGSIHHGPISSLDAKEFNICAYRIIRESNYIEWRDECEMAFYDVERALKGFFYEIEFLD